MSKHPATGTPVTLRNIHRTIFEMCKVMTNNDERVIYGRFYHWQEEGLPGRIKFSRPTFEEENLHPQIAAFLDNPALTQKSEETVGDLTKALDAVYGIAQKIEVHKFLHREKFTLSLALSQIVASNFYDCLSGGMDTMEYLVIVELAKSPVIDKTSQVYPSQQENWYTLEDFIATCPRTGSLGPVIKALRLIKSTPNTLLLGW